MTDVKTRVLVRLLQLPLIVGLVVLLPAGTFDFWQVYVYFGIILTIALLVLRYFLRHDPALIERRLRTGETEATQKKVIGVSLILSIAMFMLPGFDRRFGWSEIPLVLVLLADLLVAAGYLFTAYVMKTNSFASRIIEVEKNQQVIRTGPYAVIRHPMYLGVGIMFLATPVALGSWWGLIPAVLTLFLLVPRILNEEEVLRRELAGYDEYCKETPWRLFPSLW